MKIDRINQDILELITISIDYPCKLMNRFEWSDRSGYRYIEKLIKDGYVRKHRKDKIASLRITKRGKEHLIESNPKRFERYMKTKRYGKSDKVKRLRIHRIASTYTTMKKLGVSIYEDEKPAIFSEREKVDVDVDKPIFYSAVEIKEFGPECTKIKFSRAVGVLLTSESEGFIVYNTNNCLMKWSSRAEQRLYGVLTGILLKNSIQIDDFVGIMFGNNMETAKTQLLSNGGIKNSFFKVDNTYREFYYVPENQDGDFQLRILINTDIREKIKELVKQSFRINTNTLPFASDGVDTQERPALLAYEFDMEKIRRFKNGLEMFEEHGIVICFDFQRRVLEEYFGELARIVTFSKDMVAKELNVWNEK